MVYVGFALAVVLSTPCSPRIALASGTAFVTAQLLDILVFNAAGSPGGGRRISSALGSLWDTAVFFGLAFAGTGLPWVTWAIGDLGVKGAGWRWCCCSRSGR